MKRYIFIPTFTPYGRKFIQSRRKYYICYVLSRQILAFVHPHIKASELAKVLAELIDDYSFLYQADPALTKHVDLCPMTQQSIVDKIAAYLTPFFVFTSRP